MVVDINDFNIGNHCAPVITRLEREVILTSLAVKPGWFKYLFGYRQRVWVTTMRVIMGLKRPFGADVNVLDIRKIESIRVYRQLKLWKCIFGVLFVCGGFLAMLVNGLLCVLLKNFQNDLPFIPSISDSNLMNATITLSIIPALFMLIGTIMLFTCRRLVLSISGASHRDAIIIRPVGRPDEVINQICKTQHRMAGEVVIVEPQSQTSTDDALLSV